MNIMEQIDYPSTNKTIPEIKPVKRKRGRPPASAAKLKLEPESPAEASPKVEDVFSPSSRGRIRKSINFYNLENPVDGDQPRTSGRKHKRVPTESDEDLISNKEDRKMKFIKKPRQIKADNVKMEEVSPLKVSADDLNNEETSRIINDEFVETELCKDDEDLNNSNSELNNSSSKFKRYNRNGHTKNMMGSLFTMFKNVNQNESPSGDFVKHSPKLGRNRLPVKVEPINDAFTCGICNQNIEVSSWNEHRDEVHNGLTWKVGEVPMDFNNEKLVQGIIKKILKKKSNARCEKCKQKFSEAEPFISHYLSCDGTINPNVQCAICNNEIEKTKWQHHKLRMHNNLAWRVGDQPLDLSNQAFVMSVLNALYKNKKPLHCYKCDQSKKSVVGFLSHQATCSKTLEELEMMKIQCTICSSRFLPVSLPSHMKLCHGDGDKKNGFDKFESPNSSNNGDAFDSSRKRSAATRALNIINQYKSDVLEDDCKYYLPDITFTEDFASDILLKELTINGFLLCKFKNCAYKFESLEQFTEHVRECECKEPNYLVCKLCLFVVTTESESKNHITTVHRKRVTKIDTDFDAQSVNDDDADDNEAEQKQLLRKCFAFQKQKASTHDNLKIKPMFMFNFHRPKKNVFEKALEWTLEFCNEHFSTPNLHSNLRFQKSDYLLLDSELMSDYLPPIYESCDIAETRTKGYQNCLNTNYDLRKLELFECIRHENDILTIFCGGPISALAWLPTPYNSTESIQILAVATFSNADKKYSSTDNYNEKTVIQFWNFGTLRNRNFNGSVNLAFNFAVDYGPIWHLEWCPSGCYNLNEEESDRLGLLAVAGSDDVYIYAVPNLINNEEDGLIYKDKPILKLMLQTEFCEKFGKTGCIPTKISWSKAAGHTFIAVGYSSGLVALFDLNTESKLLRKKVNNTEILFPYKSFQAHRHLISALALNHLNGGNRILLTGSFDKTGFIWDLQTNTKITSIKKQCTDGGWFTNWISAILTGDESGFSYKMSTNTTILPVRGFLSEPTYVVFSSSSIASASISDWLNLVVQGTVGGEIMGYIGHRLIYNLDVDKSISVRKYLYGYTKLLEKNKTPEERCADALQQEKIWNSQMERKREDQDQTHSNLNCSYEPLSYEQVKEKYALLFCDTFIDSFSDFPADMHKQIGSQSKKFHVTRPNIYQLQAVNKVAVNPNLQSSLYYATGYQAGFVRITCMKFLSKDPLVI